MPYSIDWSDNHSHVVFYGKVTYQQLREVGPAHFGDSKFDNIKYAIMDFTRADLSQVKLEQPTILASIDSTAVRYKAKLKLAFVVRDEYQRTLCEKYIQDSIEFLSSWTHRIFSSAEEARKWCELVDSSRDQT